MGWGIAVRDVERCDFEQWRTLWDGYHSFYGRTGEAAFADDVTLTTWGRFFDSYEPVHGLVAEHAGTLLGLTHYIFHRNTTMIGPTCYLQDLFTSEATRGKGVGRKLITEVYERASRAGAKRVYWQTHESNAPARKLYDNVARCSGFIVYRKELA
ncbi:N-acetyltransferase family protein [Bosea sp. RAF48]|uniref:GNAT family N-acetyltransferase n=1 Tax=Bosea sp. RAF48 TaxID=3237480 RepID=UPI003F90738D